MNYIEYEEAKKKRIEKNVHRMEVDGVHFVDLETAYIDENVKVGRGTVIGPSVVITGETIIGENCNIDQNCHIEDTQIGDRVKIMSSYLVQAEVGDDTSVGPFAYLRPNSVVGKKCKIGDFVEVKNSKIGDGTKAAHLTYIGDSDLGREINLGCGVVFVNYDGQSKYRTIVEDKAFIGCNTNLVAPVKVGKNAYIAAGSTVTDDVEPGALYIARSKGTQKENWVAKSGKYKNK